MPLLISSLQNPRIKNIVKLNNRRHRDTEQMTAVEGVREIARALQKGVVPIEAFICPPLLDETETAVVLEHLYQLDQRRLTRLFEVTPAVFAKIAYRGDSGGLLITVPFITRSLADIALSRTPFLAIVEGGEKPGNLGAILRTADAAGVDAVIVSENPARPGTDLHNPNTVRASLGALFTVPVAVDSTPDVIAWLQQNDILIAAATPDGTDLYTAVNMTVPIALVLGSEAEGLDAAWLEAADVQLIIPMQGVVDSLNLSVSAALLLYEVVRQRGQQPENGTAVADTSQML